MCHADISSGQLGEGYRAVPDLLCILSRSITQACRTAKRLHQGEQSDAAASPTVHHSDDSDDAHISENMFWTSTPSLFGAPQILKIFISIFCQITMLAL